MGVRFFYSDINRAPPAVKRVLAASGLTTADIEAVIAHQASMRTLHTLADRLGIPFSKITTIMKGFGNTGAASLPMTLDERRRKEGLDQDDLVLFMGLGAGMTWGAAVM